MNTFLKYIIPLTLAVGLIGCQKDSKTKKAPTSPQQNNAQLMQGPQQSAENIDLADGEADKFVQAATNMQQVQMKAQQKMIGIIKDQGLDIKTYQKIAQSKQGDPSATKPDVSDKQMKEYKNASEKMKKAQQGVQKKMIAAINEAGMKKERFQQISRAVRYDSTLRKTIRTKMKKKAQQKLNPDSNNQ